MFDGVHGKNQISLCMIVKDEEGCLERALLSVKDLVDETIVVDTGSNKVIETLNVGDGPAAMAITPDGKRVYVVNHGWNTQGTVSVIENAKTTKPVILGTPIPVGTSPKALAITSDGSTVYVMNQNPGSEEGSISVINTKTNKLITGPGLPIKIGKWPLALAIVPDGNLYVIDDGSAPYDNGFDNEKGLVMIGRASSTKQFKKSLKVATVTFDIISEGTLMIDSYDYRNDLSGHTSANSLIDGKPYNILIKPNSPALAVEN